MNPEKKFDQHRNAVEKAENLHGVMVTERFMQYLEEKIQEDDNGPEFTTIIQRLYKACFIRLGYMKGFQVGLSSAEKARLQDAIDKQGLVLSAIFTEIFKRFPDQGYELQEKITHINMLN